MGGTGSSRWHKYRRRTLVEECLPLDLTDLRELGILASPSVVAGRLGWQATGTECQTVGDVLREFERAYLPTVKVRTQETWSADIHNHLIRFFGSTPLPLLELTAAFRFGEEMHLGSYGPNQREGRRYAGWTIRRNYTVLKTALNWYWRKHKIEQRNPASDVWEAWEKLRKRYNIQLGRGKTWTREEVTIILEEARGLPMLTTGGARWATPVHAMLRLALGAGLRLGEVTGLQWDRIDFLLISA